MWNRIKGSVLRMRLRHLASQLSGAAAHAPERELCEQLLRQISAEKFTHYKSSIGMAVVVNTAYVSIDHYTAKLDELVNFLHHEGVIKLESIHVDEPLITLEAFFLDKEGCYQDVQVAVTKFQTAALKLCAVMEQSDHETHGRHEHNLRMLTKLFINLRTIAGYMVEVSLTIEV